MRLFRFDHKAWWTGSWRDLHRGPSALYSWLLDSWKLILLRLVPVSQTQHCIQPDQCINAINLAGSLKAKDGGREREMPIKSCHQHNHTINSNADTVLWMERQRERDYIALFHEVQVSSETLVLCSELFLFFFAKRCITSAYAANLKCQSVMKLFFLMIIYFFLHSIFVFYYFVCVCSCLKIYITCYFTSQ